MKTIKPSSDGDMLLDTSKMTKGKREALEIAEAARQQTWEHPSFAGELFMVDSLPT